MSIGTKVIRLRHWCIIFSYLILIVKKISEILFKKKTNQRQEFKKIYTLEIFVHNDKYLRFIKNCVRAFNISITSIHFSRYYNQLCDAIMALSEAI